MRSLTNVSVRGTTTLAFSAARALITDASGLIETSTVTATELGYVSGATSNLQAQIDAIPTGFGNVDGGIADAYFGWIGDPIDASNASATYLDGVYLNGGTA
jgi:hypothetical protein